MLGCVIVSRIAVAEVRKSGSLCVAVVIMHTHRIYTTRLLH